MDYHTGFLLDHRREPVRPSITGAPAPATPATDSVTPLPTPAGATERKSRTARPAAVKHYSVDLPVYLINEIRSLSFNTKRTKKRVILEALKEGKLTVKDIDIHESGPDA